MKYRCEATFAEAVVQLIAVPLPFANPFSTASYSPFRFEVAIRIPTKQSQAPKVRMQADLAIAHIGY
jgi:hypothetical protein